MILFPPKVLLVALLFGLPFNYYAGAIGSPEVASLESILAKSISPSGPGVVVLVGRDGKELFCHGYGWSDREKQVLATPETQFRIGSVTKQFTAAAILRLAGEKRLTIEDPLSKYFPHYPGGDKITLHQLLNHTSGLRNYTAHPDFMDRVIHPIAASDVVAWFQNDPPDFPPGEQYEYCNTGYFLLGQIVEQVSGLGLATYWQKQFFDPLEMHNTGLYVNAEPPNHAAKGYSFVNNAIKPAIDWDMSWAKGAGALYSTVGDLWRWTEALHGGKVLPTEEYQMMITEGTATKKETLIRYCMGLDRSEVGWLPVIEHNGALDGFLSSVMWFPESKTTVVVLVNAKPELPHEGPGEISLLAAHAFLGNEMAAQAPKVDLTIEAKSYPDYVGHYNYPQSILEITNESSHLYGQLTNQERFEIYPSGVDSFFLKVAEARLVFNRDSTGGIVSVTHTQNGNTCTCLKLSEAELGELSPQLLDGYVGRYQYGPAHVLSVTRQGKQLFAQLTGQQAAPIFPRSDHEFYWKIVTASVEFVRDKDGKVTGAIHHQNGHTLNAPKLVEVDVVLTPAELDAFVGKYQAGAGVFFTVTRTENQLYVQLTGQPEFPIFPRSDHEFFLKVVDASLEFTREKDGLVNGLILSQNGGLVNAPKVISPSAHGD